MRINQIIKLSILLSLFTGGSNIYSTSSELKSNGIHTGIAIRRLMDRYKYSPELEEAVWLHRNDVIKYAFATDNYNTKKNQELIENKLGDLINNPKKNILSHLKANKGLVKRCSETTALLLKKTSSALLYLSTIVVSYRAAKNPIKQTAFEIGFFFSASAVLYGLKYIKSTHQELDSFISDLEIETIVTKRGIEKQEMNSKLIAAKLEQARANNETANKTHEDVKAALLKEKQTTKVENLESEVKQAEFETAVYKVAKTLNANFIKTLAVPLTKELSIIDLFWKNFSRGIKL